MTHIVLLGDSIFDNAAYVGHEPDVIAHLKNLISPNDRATLRAVDGSLVEDVSRQMSETTGDETHLVISAGGNNALMNADILSLKVDSSAETFQQLAKRVDDFDKHYRQMLENVLSRRLPAAVCTVYYPAFADPVIQKLSVTALAAFNDVIIRQAFAAGIPILDLRLVCNEESDYANEIEPSATGGLKIAKKILETVENHSFSGGRTSVYF